MVFHDSESRLLARLSRGELRASEMAEGETEESQTAVMDRSFASDGTIDRRPRWTAPVPCPRTPVPCPLSSCPRSEGGLALGLKAVMTPLAPRLGRREGDIVQKCRSTRVRALIYYE